MSSESVDGPNSIAVMGSATGENSSGGYFLGDAVGVRGDGKGWHGVVGFSEGGFGVYGEGLTGGTGVVGKSTGWHAVGGFSESTTGGAGVYAEGVGPGVIGVSKTWHGVYGESPSTTGGAGVWGEHKGGGSGVVGVSQGGAGVYGEGVGPGVIGVSKTWHGVYGESPSTTGGAGVWGEHKGGGSGVVGVSQGGAGVYGKGGRVAAFFEGNVEITGDVRLTNADCAEDFDVANADTVEPGTVMVLGDDATLQPSQTAYDKRVAGVVSGAGGYKPGIVLDKQSTRSNRKPIALLGKVYCKVDASYAPVEIGDLLTTSPTPGHAMKASDQQKAFGAVIGKALGRLSESQALIPILIALQ
jgi:hypothetical protein